MPLALISLLVFAITAISLLLFKRGFFRVNKLPVGVKHIGQKNSPGGQHPPIERFSSNEFAIELDPSSRNHVFFRYVGKTNLLETMIHLRLRNESRATRMQIHNLFWDLWLRSLHIKHGKIDKEVILEPRSEVKLTIREVLLDSESADVLWVMQQKEKDGYLEGAAAVVISPNLRPRQKSFAMLKLSPLIVGAALPPTSARIEETDKDGLTQLLQRKYLEENLQSLIAENIHRGPISLALIDIDNFKRVNDNAGHLVGDEVLKTISQMIKETVGNTGLSIRYGGDELVVVFTACPPEEVKELMEELRKRFFEADFPSPEGMVKATVSIGIATAFEYVDGKNLIKHADDMLRLIKQTGKNQVRVNQRRIEPIV